MLRIDQYAYSNRLRFTHPAEKFAFAVITLIVCLAVSSLLTSLVITLLMAGMVILRAGIPMRFYLKLISIPMSFLILGVLAIAVSFSGEPSSFLWGIEFRGFTIGITGEGLQTAANVFCKSLGAISCLYFLSLTTPMVEIISTLKKLKVPGLFIELMTLIYRYIFVFMETADKIYTSQSSRCGHTSIKASYYSLAQLTSNLFTKSYHYSQMLHTALMARCYKGELNVLDLPYAFSKKNVALIAVVDLGLVILALWMGGGFSLGWHS
jgi:cobalt/nickel transport system permease protein